MVAILEKVSNRPDKSDRPVSGQKKITRHYFRAQGECVGGLGFGGGGQKSTPSLLGCTAALGRKAWEIEVDKK